MGGSSSRSLDDFQGEHRIDSTLTKAHASTATVSIAFPCLNERESIGGCVETALGQLAKDGFRGEVVVADNGSTDGSPEIAMEQGAPVVVEGTRGYGAACRRALLEARSDYVVLLDADGTYPIDQLGDFIRPLASGRADMVIGNRFAGRMEKDAMPLLNRILGNPALSGLTRSLFRIPLADIHCGMRAIRRDLVDRLDLRTPGMEFATEMIVRASDRGFRIAEVPIRYGARQGASKLNPLRDGWRHVEYMLVFAPTAAFVWPGILLGALGFLVQLLLISGPRMLLFRTWRVHTNLAGVAAALAGITLLAIGVMAIAFGRSAGVEFRHSRLARFISNDRGGVPRRLGLAMLIAGAAIWGLVVAGWVASGFGSLAAVPTLSIATTLLIGGLELVSAAMIVRIMGLGARADSIE